MDWVCLLNNTTILMNELNELIRMKIYYGAAIYIQSTRRTGGGSPPCNRKQPSIGFISLSIS